MEEDDVPEAEASSFTPKTLCLLLSKKLPKLRYRPSAADKKFVRLFSETWQTQQNFIQMTGLYLPPYLYPIVGEWKRKISEKSYAKIGLAWKLFAEVNAIEFEQHLAPTPNAKGRYSGIDSTRFVLQFTPSNPPQTDSS